ncbi:transglycosylase SLT domain-containing protein [Xanthobacter sp. DSM 24535]
MAGPLADRAAAAGETVDQALCRLIEDAARAEALPAPFLTRLIWRESSFRSHVVSSKGAQGIAQFMPGTAAERGLKNPFDPEAALPAAARLLADLHRRFGNLGLAAAAYNAGPARVDAFLAGRSGLPSETRLYVRLITGRTAEDWAAQKPGEAPAAQGFPEEGTTCLAVVASLRAGAPALASVNESPDFAPWGVQVAGAFSKSVALAAYGRAATRFAGVIADKAPMVIGTRVPGRGRGAFYRVRLPAQTRADANALCASLRKAGGACIVLAN